MLLVILFFSLGAKVNDVVPWVLDVILNKHIVSPNPHMRQAACIWLLSLVRKLNTHSEVKVGRLQARCGSAQAVCEIFIIGVGGKCMG